MPLVSLNHWTPDTVRAIRWENGVRGSGACAAGTPNGLLPVARNSSCHVSSRSGFRYSSTARASRFNSFPIPGAGGSSDSSLITGDGEDLRATQRLVETAMLAATAALVFYLSLVLRIEVNNNTPTITVTVTVTVSLLECNFPPTLALPHPVVLRKLHPAASRPFLCEVGRFCREEDHGEAFLPFCHSAFLLFCQASLCLRPNSASLLFPSRTASHCPPPVRAGGSCPSPLLRGTRGTTCRLHRMLRCHFRAPPHFVPSVGPHKGRMAC